MRILRDRRHVNYCISKNSKEGKIILRNQQNFFHISKVLVLNIKLNGVKSDFHDVIGLSTNWIKCIPKKLTVFII